MKTILLIVAGTGAWLGLMASNAQAQQREDTQLWSEAAGSAELSRAIEIGVEQSLRVGAQAGFERTHTDLELSVRWHEMVATTAHYRFLIYDEEQRHRAAGDLDLRVDVGQVRPSYRLRLQTTSRENDDALTVVRNRFKLAYDAPKRLEPFAALELFHALSPVSEFRENRLYFGCEWGLTKRTDLSGYLLLLREHNVQTPDDLVVIGISLSHSFREAD